MTIKEIHDLIKLVDKLEIAEFKMREADFEISIRTKKFDKVKNIVSAPPAVMSIPQPDVNPAPAAPGAPSADAGAVSAKGDSEGEQAGHLLEVKSPIVGTFYRSPSPDKPPYVKVGDSIDVGSVVCIVEAMKLFNEIESEVGGKIVKVVVEDASPVEYDQVLFLVDPNG